MYKACIVDDSVIERNGLSQMIDWQSYGIDIVGCFANAERVLKYLEQNKIDVLFADILMPKMNGLELAKIVHDNYPDVRIIFVSSYDDFSYAKFAISVNASCYLLKPVVEEELIDAVKKVVKELDNSNIQRATYQRLQDEVASSQSMVTEQLFRQLLMESCHPQNITSFLSAVGIDNKVYPHVRCVALKYTYNTPHTSSQIKLIEEEYLSDFGEEYCLYRYAYSHDMNVLAVFSKNNDKSMLSEYLNQYYDKFIESIDGSLVMGISDKSDSLFNLDILFRQAEHSCHYSFYANTSIVYYDMIKHYENIDLTVNVDSIDMFENIKGVILNKDINGAMEMLDTYIKNSGYSVDVTRSIVLTILNYIQVILYDLNISITDYFEDAKQIWNKIFTLKTVDSLKNYLKNLLTIVFGLNEYDKMSRNARVVMGVKKYIGENYSNQISVEDIAQSMFISAKQCNTIFESQEKISIFEYLTKFRMEMARQLLSDPSNKIYQVTDMVGYRNKSHFTAMFKKYYGVTPTEFRGEFSDIEK